MKKLFSLLGVAALLCGCHTQRDRDSGGATYDSGSNVQTNSRGSSGITNEATQGSGGGNLSNPDSTQPTNPNP